MIKKHCFCFRSSNTLDFFLSAVRCKYSLKEVLISNSLKLQSSYISSFCCSITSTLDYVGSEFLPQQKVGKRNKRS